MPETTTDVKPAAPASSAASTSDAATSNAGSDSSKPTNAAQVEAGSVEDKGNSAGSDGQDGADKGERERQRPPRSERRISELSKMVREQEQEIAQKTQLLEQLQKTPTNVNVPDFTGRDQISYEDYKKDVVDAATQIVDLKLATMGNVLESKLSTQNAAEKAAREIDQAETRFPVLNPRSEDYDEDLVHDLTEQYSQVFKLNPAYSFTEFLKPMTRFLETASESKPQGATEEEPRTRGTAANRSTAATRRGANAFPENGTAQEMETWFAANRGR